MFGLLLFSALKCAYALPEISISSNEPLTTCSLSFILNETLSIKLPYDKFDLIDNTEQSANTISFEVGV